MTKLSHHRSLIVFALAVALIVPTSAFASHSWGSYHWSKSGSAVTLVLGDATSGVWDTHLRNAEADWDQSSVLTLSVGTSSANPKNCRPTAGRVEVCNAKYGANGWLGLAQIWLSGGHISQGVAKMNDTYFMNEAEKRHVMCQEVGHTFGLGHTSEDGSSQNTCMDYYQNQSDSDMTSTRPNAHDYSLLDSIYSHSHLNAPSVLSDSIGSAYGYLSFTGEMDTMGEEVFRSPDGRGRVFMLDFGTDHEGKHVRLLTHVYTAGAENPVDRTDSERPWLNQDN